MTRLSASFSSFGLEPLESGLENLLTSHAFDLEPPPCCILLLLYAFKCQHSLKGLTFKWWSSKFQYRVVHA